MVTTRYAIMCCGCRYRSIKAGWTSVGAYRFVVIWTIPLAVYASCGATAVRPVRAADGAGKSCLQHIQTPLSPSRPHRGAAGRRPHALYYRVYGGGRREQTGPTDQRPMLDRHPPQTPAPSPRKLPSRTAAPSDVIIGSRKPKSQPPSNIIT